MLHLNFALDIRENVKICVITRHGELVLKGHYEYKHDFFLFRKACVTSKKVDLKC